MGKFCVKAAIVSSLAIAEEDYDTTIGAPIELKRNLIARGTARPLKGQTPQIISGGGPLRALNEERGLVATFLDWITCGNCNKKENSNQELENKIDNMEDTMENTMEKMDKMEDTMENVFSGLTEKMITQGKNIWNSESVAGGVQNLISAADQTFVEIQKNLENANKGLKTSMEKLEESIFNLPEKAHEAVYTEQIKTKIESTQAIVGLFSSLLPEELKNLVEKAERSLKEVKDELQETGKGVEANLKERIGKKFQSAKEEFKNIFGKAEEYINSTKNSLDEFGQKAEIAGQIGNSIKNLLSWKQ